MGWGLGFRSDGVEGLEVTVHRPRVYGIGRLKFGLVCARLTF